MSTNPFSPPSAVVADIASPQSEGTLTPFFPISAIKLFVLSICTLGLYQVYWFYKNWKLIKERESSDIFPAPRAIFGVLYCYQCFKKIRDFDSSGSVTTSLAAGPLAAGWIVTTLLHKLPAPYWLVSFFAVGFLIPVQIYINQVNTAVCPNHNHNSHFSFWNWVVVVFGSIIFVLALIGTLIPARG